MPTPTTTIFGTFSTTKIVRPSIKIQEALLKEVARGALGLTSNYSGTMRVFNLAQLYGYKYDFHLSFKLDPTSQWADACHFCARDEGVGKNACAYWFYNLVAQQQTNQLAWSFEGSAPDNPLYANFIDSININSPTVSPTARQMLARRASEPLDKLLAKFNALKAQGRAVLDTNQHGVRLRFA
ncbi:conserved protein of unknown function [Pararobbsia alpina]|uniref:hypothetical protein n=1 Tax=Pararobbsia alpina TaxID=621374 RepID=UPI0039A70F95